MCVFEIPTLSGRERLGMAAGVAREIFEKLALFTDICHGAGNSEAIFSDLPGNQPASEQQEDDGGRFGNCSNCFRTPRQSVCLPGSAAGNFLVNDSVECDAEGIGSGRQVDAEKFAVVVN